MRRRQLKLTLIAVSAVICCLADTQGFADEIGSMKCQDVRKTLASSNPADVARKLLIYRHISDRFRSYSSGDDGNYTNPDVVIGTCSANPNHTLDENTDDVFGNIINPSNPAEAEPVDPD